MRARWWAEGAGAALLVMLPFFFPLLLPGNMALYHDDLPLRNLIFGILLDLAAFTALFAAVVTLVSRFPARLGLIAGGVLAATALWRAGVVTGILLGTSQPSLGADGGGNSLWFDRIIQAGMRQNHALGMGLLVLFLVSAMSRPPVARVLIRATRNGLAGLAFCLIWLVKRLLYLATLPGAPNVSAGEVRALPVATRHAPETRVVWILFDELSYRLVFEQRPAGQEFPNLERLHDRSFSFDRIEPVGFYTDRVIPSLLAGKEVDAISSTATGQLKTLGPPRREWEAFDAESSLFGLAERNGWNPGIAGWWIPYCRIFASALTECSVLHAKPLGMEVYGAAANQSAISNALDVPESYLARLSGRSGNIQAKLLGITIQNYLGLMQDARALIGNEDVHFLFLHMPVPHPPGIYDRRTHRLREGGNYLDNLTLADDTLGELMQEIGASADADRTTVIVSSDHSWRVPAWETSPDWTKEEEEISGGKFDTRPVFLIHFPGQANGVEIRAAVPELEEHDIIAAILNRQIGTGAQLEALLSEKLKPSRPEDERSEGGQ